MSLKNKAIEVIHQYYQNIMSEKKSFEQRAFEVAEKIPHDKYDGTFYIEGLGEEYFEDWEEAIQQAHSDNENRKLVYAWACDIVEFNCGNIEEILEDDLENFYPGAYDNLMSNHAEAVAEINQALAKFYRRLKDEKFCALEPNYKKAVIYKA